ncbi:Rieske 2Fe-2S domain-containing protein [Streptomyces sp. NPDC001984]|uniref:Rieske 2Fe-2S domain-containing protein n=1 Tax=Streptomyces sp. NPDC002619 TaxID=3364655 RepID=UPI00367DA39C
MRATAEDQRELGPTLPFPIGWFCLGLSRELPRGGVVTRQLMDQDCVLYRTLDGVAQAVEAHCPHLGAHLGYGGKVVGQLLVCPFHRLGFAPDGACVSSPSGSPPRARLGHLPLRELNGLLLVWHGPADTQPWWEPPALPSWARPTALWKREVVAQVQDILENSFDCRHASELHGLSMRPVAPPEADGPLMRIRVRIHPAKGRLLPRLDGVLAHQTITMAGLGMHTTEVVVDRLGLTTYLWTLPTPISPTRTVLRFATTAAVTDTARLPGGTSPLLRTAASRAAARILLGTAIKYAYEDIRIWAHKRYRPYPGLASDEQAIGQFRHWARQFYPTS